jgi:hypothetical protein
MLRTLFGTALGLSLLATATTGVAQTTTSTICEPDGGYVVAYYNGTFATPEDADAQRAALRIARHGKYAAGKPETARTTAGKDEPVRYETFYSTSGTASGATESRFQALATQYRTKVLDGALSSYWEYFWDMAAGNVDNWSVLAAKSGDSRFLAITSAFPATVATLASDARKALETELNTSTTLANRQLARAQALYIERQKLLMVGYSQGTLFANKAFAKLGSPTDSTVLKQELSALPALALQSSLTTSMTALNIPTPAGNQGFFTANLSWSLPASAIGQKANPTTGVMEDIRNDLDLHVIEPTGTHVYYGLAERNKGGGETAAARQGDAGYLDKDSQTVGPEHYYASCDESVLKEGVYQITATQESREAPSQTYLTLQVAFAKGGEVFSKTWNSELAYAAKSEACPTCTGDVVGFTQPDKLVPQIKVKVTKVGAGNWKAELVN